MELENLDVSLVFLALCAASLFLFGAWIGPIRGRLGVLRGDGGDPTLHKAMRIHGNFVENAPLFAMVLLAADLLGTENTWLWAAGSRSSSVAWSITSATTRRSAPSAWCSRPCPRSSSACSWCGVCSSEADQRGASALVLRDQLRRFVGRDPEPRQGLHQRRAPIVHVHLRARLYPSRARRNDRAQLPQHSRQQQLPSFAPHAAPPIVQLQSHSQVSGSPPPPQLPATSSSGRRSTPDSA
ncbi:MAG: MAPEG family protein, partial [Myxococcales bacterium]|nr:MAPEG family protein [Myxococcales bacterium]